MAIERTEKLLKEEIGKWEMPKVSNIQFACPAPQALQSEVSNMTMFNKCGGRAFGLTGGGTVD